MVACFCGLLAAVPRPALLCASRDAPYRVVHLSRCCCSWLRLGHIQDLAKAESAGFNKDSGITVVVADVTRSPKCALASSTILHIIFALRLLLSLLVRATTGAACEVHGGCTAGANHTEDSLCELSLQQHRMNG